MVEEGLTTPSGGRLVRILTLMAALTAAGGVAACVAPGSAPTGVQTVSATRTAALQAPLASGETQIVVRAVASGAPDQELSGALCVAEAPWFRAEFASPARVLVPDFGAQAPAVAVTCRSGTASGSAVAQPQAAWSGGLGGWPAVGISVGTGTNSGVGLGLGWYGGSAGGSRGVPVVTYPELRVVIG
jgi:hypothetical protein